MIGKICYLEEYDKSRIFRIICKKKESLKRKKEGNV